MQCQRPSSAQCIGMQPASRTSGQALLSSCSRRLAQSSTGRQREVAIGLRALRQEAATEAPVAPEVVRERPSFLAPIDPLAKWGVPSVMSRAGAALGLLARDDAGRCRPVQVPTVSWTAAQSILALAAPLFLQFSIGHLAYMADTAFVGHLSDPVLLSSMVLACSLANATGYSVVHGLASASDTISGQAAGARDYGALSTTLQRSVAVTALGCAGISALWLNSESILTHLGQTPDIAAGAARYLTLTIPALWLYATNDCVDKHLLAQGIVKPGVVITTAKALLTPAFAWFFIYELGLGLDGAAYAYDATTAGAAAMTLGYLTYRSTQTQRTAEHVDLRPTSAALEAWGPYLGLALPAVIMGCMEGWATEVLIFLSGNMANAEVAVGVTGLCLQFSTLVWVTAAALGSSTGTRIANALGKGDAKTARKSAFTGLAMALGSQVLVGLAAYTYRNELVGLMTDQADVAELVGTAMPMLALCFIFDGQNVVLGNILRACGRQWTGAALNLAGWWGVGVPLAAFLGLKMGYGVAGLWGGFATASGIQAFLQWAVLMNNLDFKEEAKRSIELLKTQGGSASGAGPGAGAEGSGSDNSDKSAGHKRKRGEVRALGSGAGAEQQTGSPLASFDRV